MQNQQIILGAVAYEPKVVTIWEGFKEYLQEKSFNFDYILFSNYERQVTALFDGYIDLAWNSPLAWVKAERIAKSRNITLQALLMRDTDCDLKSLFVVRKDSAINSLHDLSGKSIAVGAVDSPQATLIPLEYLKQNNVNNLVVIQHNILVGKHGDHVGGEQAAYEAVLKGKVACACLIEGNFKAFTTNVALDEQELKVIGTTEVYDHCNFTVSPTADKASILAFENLFLNMDPNASRVKKLFELEGLNCWLKARTSGYHALDSAVDTFEFYNIKGEIVDRDYLKML